MAKRKVAVALSDWLLREVDEFADGHELSRSAVIQEAAAEYLTRHRIERESEEYCRGALEAAEDMDRYAQERTDELEGGPSSLEVLRRLRGVAEGNER